MIVIFWILLSIISSCSPVNKLGKESASHEVPEFLSAYLPQIHTAPDDPSIFDKTFDENKQYQLTLSKTWWFTPSSVLPENIHPQRSNNNVSIHIFNHKLYLAFRTGPTHFASTKTGIYIISTGDGIHWEKEMEIFVQRDVREPFLIPIDGKLRFYFFAAGVSITSFQPEYIQMYSTSGDGKWEGPVDVLNKGEVHWSVLNRNQTTYMTSYAGSHYQLKGDATVNLFFRKSDDGINWTPVGDSASVYFGGVSETAFEFDQKGNLWAVTRLEDGDHTGFGSHVAFAHAADLSNWAFPEKADPNCYMSPKMFRHGNEIYLIARKQLGNKPFGRANKKRSMTFQRLVNWVGYSLSPKTTAIYRINQEKRSVEMVMALPGAGDTAFPSIIRLNEHQFLIANYTSHPKKENISWLGGQLRPTAIYLQIITFTENTGE